MGQVVSLAVHRAALHHVRRRAAVRQDLTRNLRHLQTTATRCVSVRPVQQNGQTRIRRHGVVGPHAKGQAGLAADSSS